MTQPTDKAIAFLEKWYPVEGKFHAPGMDNWDTIVSWWGWSLKWGEGKENDLTIYMLRALAASSNDAEVDVSIGISGCATVWWRRAEVPPDWKETKCQSFTKDSLFDAVLAAIEAAAEVEDEI